ncbi:membrane-bound alkaline phosphatase-like [Culex pipiens pallens]|uniref:membrane-bound alkaline phosphatase-like n=1 Tax=Culex pipiens pallens TaxID=42434 RepID=UPI001954AA8B|nr:membrane-bound alkaline phosphatase-like [Culex pipiens pallens]
MLQSRLLPILLLVPLAVVASPVRDNDDSSLHPVFEAGVLTAKNVREQSTEFWRDHSRQQTLAKVARRDNRNVAKNVVFFLGDGLSVQTVASARVAAGGEEREFAFERFPHTGFSRTYCVDAQVADSACTATAYLAGVKANYGTLGVNGKVKRGDCEVDRGNRVESIAKWALEAGKDVGIVTTTRVTHASPAGLYANIPDRDWETDFGIRRDGCDPELVDDIAEQLVYGEIGSKLKVVLGGGRREFFDRTPDPETGRAGFRSDGKNLVKEWLNGDPGEHRRYVWSRSELLTVNPKTTDKLLGLFEPSHLQYNLDRISGNMHEEPTLAEMVNKATDILSQNPNGFFLFVEGGRIDHAHHENRARYALDETIQFDRAVFTARWKYSEEDTLIVVTADHSHTMSYAGYPTRGNDIFGFAGTGTDGLPYSTLSYANGQSFEDHFGAYSEGSARRDMRTMDMQTPRFRFPATVPYSTQTHAGEDVPVYASGPWSHLFSGSYEQSIIPDLISYAACFGSGPQACEGAGSSLL